jgi:hypothetical protein
MLAHQIERLEILYRQEQLKYDIGQYEISSIWKSLSYAWKRIIAREGLFCLSKERLEKVKGQCHTRVSFLG